MSFRTYEKAWAVLERKTNDQSEGKSHFVRQCEVQVQEMLVEEHLEHEMMMED